jgi:hypothetical protein
MTFQEHVRLAKGSLIKARKTYMRERRWGEEEWYSAWYQGLGTEVEIVATSYVVVERP